MADNNQTSDNSQPVDKTTTKKSTKMQKSSTKGDDIDKGRTMTGSKPDKIDMNPEFYHNVNSSFEADFGTPINELNVQQRLKKALNFRKIKSKVQMAKKRAMLRKGTGKVIAKRAKVLAIKMIKSKLAGNRDVSSLSPMEKQRVEKLVSKRSDTVKKLALRLIPAVKKKEAKRFLKKESIDLDNLAEAVAFINESINSAGGGGVRGMGYSSGNPDGEPSNYVSANIADFDKRNDEMKNTKAEHDKLHLKKESVKLDPNDSHQRDDGTNMLVKTFKHDTPGETNKLHSHFKRTAKPVPKNIDKAFESFINEETREAVPRSGQPRKSIQNVVRDAACRSISTGPYRQQSIQKNIIDEQLIVLENAITSIDRGEYDYEGAMARTQLQTIYRNSKDLVDILKADENMPEWVQSKISLAQDYISCVRDYLLSRKELGESEVWDKPNPVKKHSKLSPSAKAKARARAKAAGRPYPNMVDNIWAARNEEFGPLDEVAAWQRKEGKNQEGGLNQKGVDSYRRENPGSKLKTAVTTKPSKLDPDSKAAKRRKSFCARMSGMKKQNTSAKTANDPDSRINKSLRKWNC
jgi:hypothetical protein